MKAQVAMEFLALVGVMLLMFIVFLLVITDQSVRISSTKEELIVDDIATSIQKELLTAASVQDGYSRNFTIPFQVQGVNYTIYQSNESFALISKRQSASRKIPPLVGNLMIGSNMISKRNGTIYLN